MNADRYTAYRKLAEAYKGQLMGDTLTELLDAIVALRAHLIGELTIPQLHELIGKARAPDGAMCQDICPGLAYCYGNLPYLKWKQNHWWSEHTYVMAVQGYWNPDTERYPPEVDWKRCTP